MAKKCGPRRPGVNKGGRPKFRDCSEVQVTLKVPRAEFARLSGWCEVRRRIAQVEGAPLSDASKRSVMLLIWRKFWRDLPPRVRRAVESNPKSLRELESRSEAMKTENRS